MKKETRAADLLSSNELSEVDTTSRFYRMVNYSQILGDQYFTIRTALSVARSRAGHRVYSCPDPRDMTEDGKLYGELNLRAQQMLVAVSKSPPAQAILAAADLSSRPIPGFLD